MIRVGLTYNKNHILHDYRLKGYHSPENPDRLFHILQYLREHKIFDNDQYDLFPAMPASREDILRVHTAEYIDSIKHYADEGGGFLGNDTYVTKDSYQVLLQAAGCAIEAGNVVVNNEFDHSFAMIRPPGHHSGVDSYGGFCLFNHAAVLARYLQRVRGLKKVAIVNIDAHASNGTHNIFYSDPTVLCLSVHQDPHTLYPHTGYVNQTGARPAFGYCINMEMPEESGNQEYAIVFDQIVLKMLDRFEPDIVIVECGFDSYYKESLTQLDLTTDGYFNIISSLAEKWNLCLLLEGGYHDDMGLLVEVLLSALVGKKYIEDDVDQITLLVSRHTSARSAFNDNLGRLKSVLGLYWDIDA